MERGPSTHLLSWLLLPAALALLLSALSLPRQPYTGITPHGDRIASVVPGSPGERADLRPGDRLIGESPGRSPHRPGLGPLAGAAPGRPLSLTRERDGKLAPVWLVPETLPDGERRWRALLLAVASGFVLLGGWVWSERRDRLTRTFFLLCLAFAWLLTPMPSVGAPGAGLPFDLAYSGIQLFLPALFVHFFALFPETPRARGRLSAGIRGSYGLATLLFLAYLAATLLDTSRRGASALTLEVVQSAAALWFAAGLLWALVLFVRSYARAASSDARRRLRVALIGTVLGAGPLAALILLRNLSPGTALPGERWTVGLTLLVPLSFAWAAVVHRVFDFRVALRAATIAGLAALAAVAAYAAGDALAAGLRPAQGDGLTGGPLALLGLIAALAGPARPWLTSLGERLVPIDHEPSLGEWTSRDPGVSGAGEPRTVASSARVLRGACQILVETLRLDRCIALELSGARPECIASHPDARGAAPSLSPDFRGALDHAEDSIALEDLPLAPADRESLELAGFVWALPVGEPPAVALLLGRRLAGAWLSLRELRELQRLATRLAMELENLELRRERHSRVTLDRELAEASQIQAHWLPQRAPAYPTLDFAAATLSSEPVGGDYYDFVEHADRAFTLAVGDAAGKGVPAALLLSGVQARFRDAASRAASPGALLEVLNLELSRLDQPEKFVGMLCARFDARSGALRFANAGLTPPLLRRRSGAFEEHDQSGLLLGVSPEAAYAVSCVQLRAGDLVVVYTDGLTEARRGDELYGTSRVRRVLQEHAHRRAADVLEELLNSVREFADRPLDDLTAVVLKQLTEPIRPRGPDSGLKWRAEAADTFR